MTRREANFTPGTVSEIALKRTASLGAALDGINDTAELKDQLRIAQRRQALIADFAKDAMEPIELGDLLAEATTRIAQGINVDHTKVLRYEPETADFLVVAGTGWKDGVVGSARMRADMASPAGRAFQTGQAVLVDDINEQIEFRVMGLIREYGIVSLVNVPLYVDGQVWGVLEADSSLPRDFTAIDADFLSTFAGILGAAILRKMIEAKAEVDATKIAEQAAERKLLLRELQHRLKNNFQIILSLINLQQKKVSNAEAARGFAHIADRVSAIALAHDQLALDRGLGQVRIGAYLRALCSYIDPGREDIQIKADAQDLQISMDQAVPIGLIVNEAITNAMKHAFPDGRAGMIQVNFEAAPNLASGELKIVDNGVGLRATRPGSAGRSLIQALAGQLGGAVSTEAAPMGGTQVSVAFPLRLARPDSQERSSNT